MGGLYEYLLILPSLFFFCYCFFRVRTYNVYVKFNKFIVVYILLTLLSSISAKMQGQPYMHSLNACHLVFSLFIYHFLCKYRITEKVLMKCVVTLSFVYVVIYAVQQFTYPVYYFYTRGDTVDEMGFFHALEIRNGIYRFFMLGDQMVILAFFYWIYKYMETQNSKVLFYSFFYYIGIFMTGSRQYTFLTLAIALIYIIFNKRHKYRNVFIACFVLGLLFHFTSDSMNITSQQLAATESDSRFATFLYIISELSEKPFSLIFGDGIPYKTTSAFGARYEDLAMTQIVPSDLGIIGYLYQRGLLFILLIISFYVMYYHNYYKNVPAYLKMFFIYLVFNVMVFPIARFDQCYLIGIFLYLTQIKLQKYEIYTS